jgi:alpha-glucosidase
MMKLYFVAALLLFFLATTPAAAAPVATASSPNGAIQVALELDNDGRVTYTVTRNGKPLIAPSKLGFILSDSTNMVRGFSFVSQSNGSGDDRWEQPWGERRFVRNHYNQLTARFKQGAHLQREYAVQFAMKSPTSQI